jgi:hypothetical protein
MLGTFLGAIRDETAGMVKLSRHSLSTGRSDVDAFRRKGPASGIGDEAFGPVSHSQHFALPKGIRLM